MTRSWSSVGETRSRCGTASSTAMVAAGIELLEMTFPPADWQSAIEAFGSADGVSRQELEARGLALKSGFHIALGWGADTDPAQAADEPQRPTRTSSAMPAVTPSSSGRRCVVRGTPSLRSSSTTHTCPRSPTSSTASGMRHCGWVCKTAVHTEAHSVFCTQRDVDLLMTLTDPDLRVHVSGHGPPHPVGREPHSRSWITTATG